LDYNTGRLFERRHELPLSWCAVRKDLGRLTEGHEPQPLLKWRDFRGLTPLSEAFAALASCCGGIAPMRIRAKEASGRILADPIPAPAAFPSTPIALCDGWAVASADTLGASSYTPGFAGAAPRRVSFGDRLPDFADAVLPLPHVLVNAGVHEILSPAAPGDGVRPRAGDFAEGETILLGGNEIAAGSHCPAALGRG
jgi:molybdopterin biosynthesis enzyme